MTYGNYRRNLVNPTSKNHSNGVDNVLMEIVQFDNARKKPVKGN
jgi:hypothetical protein